LACVFPISVHDPLSSYSSPAGPSLCKSADKIAQTEEQATSQASVVCLERPETGINRAMYTSTEELSQDLREPSLPDPSIMPANERMSSVSEQNDNNEEHRPRNSVLRSLQRKPLGYLLMIDPFAWHSHKSFRVQQSMMRHRYLKSPKQHAPNMRVYRRANLCKRWEGCTA
jgi:hypothetical protein